jgi:TonB family protein
MGRKSSIKEVSMFYKKMLTVIMSLFIFSSLLLCENYSMEMKMRFYKGVRKGKVEPPQFVTSSYLQPTVAATIPSKYLLTEEEEQIRKVFNLEGVTLMTEADLRWSGKKGDVAHMFRLNGKSYLMQVSVFPREREVPAKEEKKEPVRRFQIQIHEQAEENKIPLFDTEINLPGKNIAIFGFEDKEGKPYFLSFHVVSAAVPAPPPPPPPPTPPPPPEKAKQIRKGIEEFEKGAVRCVGDIKPPKLLKIVKPVYPEKARQEKVEGVVILGVRTDKEGRVSKAMIYKSKDPLLNEAALDAVKQWVYEPLIIEEEPKEAIFTVTVMFKLNEEKKEKAGDVEGGVLRVGDMDKPPKLIKKVAPVYPEDARQAGIQGIVVLEATTDKEGNVAKVRILKSESSLLNQAAVDSLKQWKYEPYHKDGKTVPVAFTVTIQFKLK